MSSFCDGWWMYKDGDDPQRQDASHYTKSTRSITATLPDQGTSSVLAIRMTMLELHSPAKPALTYITILHEHEDKSKGFVIPGPESNQIFKIVVKSSERIRFLLRIQPLEERTISTTSVTAKKDTATITTEATTKLARISANTLYLETTTITTTAKDQCPDKPSFKTRMVFTWIRERNLQPPAPPTPPVPPARLLRGIRACILPTRIYKDASTAKRA